jgi:UDP-N-acetylglucosamine--N-acetylmuramyl-(pentapeptide) pyrophosphoryl-undecaprenol N-acetylglucosamine transferase
MIIERKVSREEANRFFGLDPASKTVLVTGGSLGARGINEAIASGLEIVKKAKVQLIWQTGISFAPRAKILTESTEHIWTAAFIPEMDQAFAAADLVVSRSGAMAIAELLIHWLLKTIKP